MSRSYPPLRSQNITLQRLAIIHLSVRVELALGTHIALHSIAHAALNVRTRNWPLAAHVAPSDHLHPSHSAVRNIGEPLPSPACPRVQRGINPGTSETVPPAKKAIQRRKRGRDERSLRHRSHTAMARARTPSNRESGSSVGAGGLEATPEPQCTAPSAATAQCAESLAPAVEGFNQTARLCRFAPRPTKDRTVPPRPHQAMVGKRYFGRQSRRADPVIVWMTLSKEPNASARRGLIYLAARKRRLRYTAQWPGEQTGPSAPLSG